MPGRRGTPRLADAAQAQRERVFIARTVGQCRSKNQIESALVGQYGPGVLALPTPSGSWLAAYLVPALAATAVLAGLALVAAGWRRRFGASPRAALADRSPRDPPQAARIDAELERYRR